MPELPEIGDLSIADAQLCFRHALQLRRDGNRCRPHARYSLLETSLEEAAKGLMILFRHRFRIAGVNLEQLARHPRNQSGYEALEACLVRNRNVLDEAHFRDSFSHHPVKLEYLEFIFDLLKSLGPVAAVRQPGALKRNRSLPWWIRFVGYLGDTRVGLRLIEWGIRSSQKDAMRHDPAGTVRRRNESLYIGVSADGSRCVRPDVDPAELRLLANNLGFVLSTLRGMLISAQFG